VHNVVALVTPLKQPTVDDVTEQLSFNKTRQQQQQRMMMTMMMIVIMMKMMMTQLSLDNSFNRPTRRGRYFQCIVQFIHSFNYY
jgi:predicted nucleic acid-binding Zn ribbon protein